MASEETVIYSTFLTALAVLTMLVVVAVLSITRHQGRKQRWLRSLALRDITLVEEERRRISEDLHDDFGSVLAAVSLGLDALQEKYPADSSILKTQANLATSLGRLKEISHNLVPRVLEIEGLCAAISGMAEEINYSTGVLMHISGSCEDHDFDPNKALLLYRVIQEVVTNALKHAQARVIQLTMHEQRDRLMLEISDDGTGFNYEEAVATSRSFGLRNIRSRLSVLRAVCTVESSAGKGSRYTITIPLQHLRRIHGTKDQNPHYHSG